MSGLLQKFHFPIEDVLNSFQTPGTSFQATDLIELFDEIICFGI